MKKNIFKNKLTAISPFIATIIFLLVGFTKGIWHPTWLVFLIIPAIPLLFDLFSGKNGKIGGLLNFLTVVAYLIMGFIFNWWHPGWVIFILVPVFYILFGVKNYDEFK